jgi:hypothetical protein
MLERNKSHAALLKPFQGNRMRIAWMTGFDLFRKYRSRQAHIFPNLLDGSGAWWLRV